MPKEKDIPFLSIIKETFGSVFEEYGFELQEEAVWTGMGEYIITAKNGDVALNFYLGLSQLFYLCSVGALVHKTKSRHNPPIRVIA